MGQIAMKAGLTFPLLTIGNRMHHQGSPGGPALDYVASAKEFSTLSVHDLKSGSQVGKILIGSDGRQWEIRSVTDRGVGSPWKIWWILGLFFGFLHWVDYELVELSPLSLEQIKDRVEAMVRDNPDDWGFDDEDDPEPSEGTLEDFVETLRAMTSVTDLINELFDQQLV